MFIQVKRMEKLELTPIAYIKNGFCEKFGLPRQSGLVPQLTGEIVFEKPYRNKDAFRGLEGFSHLWLLWGFSASKQESWSPTVRPPRLGGNQRMGVFATRSPFRPNPIGLSCVKIEKLDTEAENGPVLRVSGADLMDGTPIYDIKPYLPYADSYPEALAGFGGEKLSYKLTVDFPEALLSKIDEKERAILLAVLEQDPRPAYQQDAERVYGFTYATYEIKFTVEDTVLHVQEVICL